MKSIKICLIVISILMRRYARVYLFFPRCNATSHNFVVPCRETYEELREECLAGIKSFNIKGNLLTALQLTYNYEYLPSRFESIQCYYEEVICESPPNVTDAVIVVGLYENEAYTGGTHVRYSCTDDSKEIVGNSTVKCMYNAKWSDPPLCVPKSKSHSVGLVILLLVFLLITVLIILIIVIITIKRSKRIKILSEKCRVDKGTRI